MLRSTFRSDVSDLCLKSKVQGVLRGYLAKASVHAFLKTSSMQDLTFLFNNLFRSMDEQLAGPGRQHFRGIPTRVKKFRFRVSSVKSWFLKRKNVQYTVWVVYILWKEETLGHLPLLIFDKTVTVQKHSAIHGNKYVRSESPHAFDFNSHLKYFCIVSTGSETCCYHSFGWNGSFFQQKLSRSKETAWHSQHQLHRHTWKPCELRWGNSFRSSAGEVSTHHVIFISNIAMIFFLRSNVSRPFTELAQRDDLPSRSNDFQVYWMSNY